MEESRSKLTRRGFAQAMAAGVAFAADSRNADIVWAMESTSPP